MATVAGVRFKKAGKVYYFDPSQVWPNPGDPVIVETARGLEIGEVVTGARQVGDEQIVSPLKPIIRIATPEDEQHQAWCEQREKEAMQVCQDKVEKLGLEMKLVEVECAFDNSKIIFYFTANGRVDFRELVKELASAFRTRIEMRQIGVRDEAKMLGGLGSCGRPLCCAAFLNDFQPVSIRMAKEQNLSLNPTKISGQCGRLMCCLKYEQDNYEKTLKRLPKVGREINTPDGVGTIVDIAVIREKVKVRMRRPDDTFDIVEYDLEEVAAPRKDAPKAAPADDEAVQTTEEAAQAPEEVAQDDIPQQDEAEAPVLEGEAAPEETPAEAETPHARRKRNRSRHRKPAAEGEAAPSQSGAAPEGDMPVSPAEAAGDAPEAAGTPEPVRAPEAPAPEASDGQE